jgi:hypothetical protein
MYLINSMKDKIEAIKKVVVEANPSILNLDFGCEIQDETGFIDTVVRVFPKSPDGEIVVKTLTFLGPGDGVYISKCKILGRPIRLADVMAAVAKTGKIIRYMSLCADDRTPICLSTKENEGIVWNLLKDDLREQTPETIDFLHSILCQI